MASSETRGGGCDPKTPCGKTNAGEDTPGTVGVRVHIGGCGPGT